MEFGSINLVVNDAELALKTYLKMIGTNNVGEVIKVTGLNDTIDIVNGYYLMTKPIKLGIFTPVSSSGRMADHLRKYGEGIHHIELHLGQDEFSKLHSSLQALRWPVSGKPIFFGRLSEAIFWLDESGEQGVPVKFATKAYHGFGEEGAVYLDTPKCLEKVILEDEYHRPKTQLVTCVIAARQFEKQHELWSTILSQPAPVRTRDPQSMDKSLVNDGRGDIFWPSSFLLQGHAKISIYLAMNEDGPISKVLARRGRNALFHNIIFLVTRDKIHQCWEQLEDAGFAMVDPKPLLLESTGNYFFFVHPTSTHGILSEFVAATWMDKNVSEFIFDWTDTEMNIVSPEINGLQNGHHV